MAEHYFFYPFGINGNLTVVPNPTQVSGTVSYQSGFPIGYEEANTSPGYLPIPRDQFNQLMYDTTGAIQQFQQTGFPSWITSVANQGTSFAYALGAQVWYLGIPYRSLIANNTDTPPSVNWAVIGQNRSTYFNYAPDTGVANQYVIAPNPVMTSYADGNVVELKPAFGNTGPCTINVNGLGAVPIKTLQNQNPLPNTIIPAGVYTLAYNSTNNAFVVQTPSLGTAAYYNAGVGANSIPQFNGAGQYPAADGSLILDLVTAAFSGSAGKIVLAGGVTIQCGSQAITSNAFAGNTITFPTAFSGTPLVFTQLNIASASSNYTTGGGGVPSTSSVSSTGFKYQPPTETTGSTPIVQWLAIGPT